jgi:hypothetical protein
MVAAELGDDIAGYLEAGCCTAVNTPTTHTSVPASGIITVSPKQHRYNVNEIFYTYWLGREERACQINYEPRNNGKLLRFWDMFAKNTEECSFTKLREILTNRW